MSDRIEVDKSLIEPVFSQGRPNEAISFGEVGVRFSHNSKTYEETAQVIMRFIPDARLLFVIPAKVASNNQERKTMTAEKFKALFLPRFGLDDKWDGKLELTATGVVLDVFVKSMGGEQVDVTFMPKTSAVAVTGGCANISSATFHLFNFPDFFGPDDYIFKYGTPPLEGRKVCGRSVLRADGWTITIAATVKTDELCKALDREGGYVITHVGQINRDDGATFTSDQLDDLIRCLHAFLSFALGRWAGVALPVGFDNAGKRVFEEWGLRLTAADGWHGSKSWFDEHHAELLTETFPGYYALWKNELWNAALWKATYWYVLANGSNTDAGLILAQTALELLAWTYCVEDRKMVSAVAFSERGLSAMDKLRILASTLNIPLALPPHLKALSAPRPGSGHWQDAMETITRIRNTLVHPHAKFKPHEGSYYEAMMLSLWYLDLVLLRLCGHKGKYGNRLAPPPRYTGKVECVPWVTDGSDKAETTNA
jgi:hypothetical protein